MPTTDNHEYNVPEQGEVNWHDRLNENFEQLDDEVVLKDTAVNRPPAGEAGRWFLATDTLRLWFDSGVEWELAAAPAVEDDGGEVAPATHTIDFGTDLDVTEEADGHIRVDATAQQTTIVEESGLSVRTAHTGSIPVSALDAGEMADLIVHVPENYEFRLLRWGCRTRDRTNPSNLRMQVVQAESGDVFHQSSEPRQVAPADEDGLYVQAGETDLFLRLSNQTGERVAAGAEFAWNMVGGE